MSFRGQSPTLDISRLGIFQVDVMVVVVVSSSGCGDGGYDDNYYKFLLFS